MISRDTKIVEKLDSFSKANNDYWSFRGRSKRAHCHGFIQYPAMMVPEMQGELMDVVLEQNTNIRTVFDPFVGSGTTLGECTIRGLDFRGIDINPLAILACETKSDAFYIDALEAKINSLKEALLNDKSNEIDISFKGLDKWFIKRVQINLCRIRRAIRNERSKWTRRFFWTVLSNTIRATCNSRSSTYKLHIKADENIDEARDPIKVFIKTLNKNFLLKKDQYKLLKDSGFISKSQSKSNIKLSVSDILSSPRLSEQNSCDLLVTSPPYGDNATTVTYGQFSYLSLMWIDTNDLNSSVPKHLLRNTASIDSASIGGSLKNALKAKQALMDQSNSYKQAFEEIDGLGSNGTKRLTTFMGDLDKSLDNMLFRMKENSYMIWTLGNRRISGVEVPLNKILQDLFTAKGCTYVTEVQRNILSKKMATRNKNVSTMTKESILVMRT